MYTEYYIMKSLSSDKFICFHLFISEFVKMLS